VNKQIRIVRKVSSMRTHWRFNSKVELFHHAKEPVNIGYFCELLVHLLSRIHILHYTLIQ